jgi:hypothetical protein
MRKLSFVETNAARWLAKHGPYCPGDQAYTDAGKQVKAILDGLVRKRCAVAEMTDDGPSYSVREMAHG